MKTLNLVDLDKFDIKYKISKFPDGQQTVDLVDWTSLDRYTDPVKITTRLNSFKDVEILICVVAAIRNLKPNCQIALYVPYFLGSRSDRKFVESGVNYLKQVICPIINSLNFFKVIVLDPHIGAIYGDSITPERQVQIYERLAAKGFAATNIVLGVGSFTYQYNTRDTLGFAAKGAWFEVESDIEVGTGGVDIIKKSYNIYKDPVTDDGTKKSLKGLLAVYERMDDRTIWCKTECTPEEESKGLLQVIYEDGKFYNQTTFKEIRERLNKI